MEDLQSLLLFLLGGFLFGGILGLFSSRASKYKERIIIIAVFACTGLLLAMFVGLASGIAGAFALGTMNWLPLPSRRIIAMAVLGICGALTEGYVAWILVRSRIKGYQSVEEQRPLTRSAALICVICLTILGIAAGPLDGAVFLFLIGGLTGMGAWPELVLFLLVPFSASVLCVLLGFLKNRASTGKERMIKAFVFSVTGWHVGVFLGVLCGVWDAAFRGVNWSDPPFQLLLFMTLLSIGGAFLGGFPPWVLVRSRLET